MDFYLNGSKKIKNFKEINNNTKTFDIELFSRYPYYFNVYNIKIISYISFIYYPGQISVKAL